MVALCWVCVSTGICWFPASESSPCRSVRRHVCLPKRWSLLTRFPTAGFSYRLNSDFPFSHPVFPTILLVGWEPALVLFSSSWFAFISSDGRLIHEAKSPWQWPRVSWSRRARHVLQNFPWGRPFLPMVLVTPPGHLLGGAALLVWQLWDSSSASVLPRDASGCLGMEPSPLPGRVDAVPSFTTFSSSFPRKRVLFLARAPFWNVLQLITYRNCMHLSCFLYVSFPCHLYPDLRICYFDFDTL